MKITKKRKQEFNPPKEEPLLDNTQIQTESIEELKNKVLSNLKKRKASSSSDFISQQKKPKVIQDKQLIK